MQNGQRQSSERPIEYRPEADFERCGQLCVLGNPELADSTGMIIVVMNKRFAGMMVMLMRYEVMGVK